MAAAVDEKDAGFRITGFLFGATAILVKVRAAIDYIVNREVIQADGNNHPVSRPEDEIDMRIVVAFLAMDSFIPKATAAANVTIDFTEADGGAASLIAGKMRPGSISSIMGRRMGGFTSEQTFELEGSPTYTWSF